MMRCLILFTACALVIRCRGDGTAEHYLENILTNSSYDSAERPPVVNDSPVKIRAGLFIASIGDLNALQMESSMTLYFRLRWNDPRLAFNHTIYGSRAPKFNRKQISRLWIPDIFISNAKAGTKDEESNNAQSLTVSPHGDIFYSRRIFAVLACPCDFHNFPLDKQTCSIQLESYGYHTWEMEIDWFTDEGPPVETPDEALKLPQFTVRGIETGSCSVKISTGVFPCLKADILLQRRVYYFLLHIYIPMVLVVLLSWVSFWINIEAAPARVMLGLLTVLTITTCATNANKNVPIVAYVKLMDMFTAGCYAFVVLSLLEYTFVNVLARREKRKKAQMPKHDKVTSDAATEVYRKVDPDHMQTNNFNTAAEVKTSNGETNIGEEMQLRRSSITSVINKAESHCRCVGCSQATSSGEEIDIFCRYFFPPAFLIFNLAFWLNVAFN